MAKDLTALRQQADTIRFERIKNANTAERVGGHLVDMLDYVDAVHEQLYDQVGNHIEINGDVTNLGDEEDITNVIDSETKKGVLKFKDRNPEGAVSRGYVILRKNTVGVNNIIDQSSFATENTIYEIRYRFDLQGQTITVPKGCILKFVGGILQNGTLKGTCTDIDANICQIFEESLILDGTWSCKESYPEWYGYKNDGSTDCINGLEYLEKAGFPIVFDRGTYCISRTWWINNNPRIRGYSMWETCIKLTDDAQDTDILVAISNEDGSEIKNGFFKDIQLAGVTYPSDIRKVKICLFVCNSTEMFRICNVRVVAATRAGIYITKTWFTLFENITTNDNYINYYICSTDNLDLGLPVGAINNVVFRNCTSQLSQKYGTYISGWNASIQFDTCDWENEKGDTAMYFEESHASVLCSNCYWELTIPAMIVNNSYQNGSLTILAGMINANTTETVFQLGKQYNVAVINLNNDSYDNKPAYFFTTEAITNTFIGTAPSGKTGVVDTIDSGSAVFFFSKGTNWNQDWKYCQTNKEWCAPSVRAISRKKDDKCPAELCVGFTDQNEVSAAGKMYQLRFRHAHPDNRLVLELLSRGASASVIVKELLSFSEEHIDVTANGGITINQVDELPTWGYFNGRMHRYNKVVLGNNRNTLIYYANGWKRPDGCAADLEPWGTSNPTVGKAFPGTWFENTSTGVIYYMNHEGTWVPVGKNKNYGTTAERPAGLGTEHTGLQYFDTTIKKPIWWSGTAWVNYNGASV